LPLFAIVEYPDLDIIATGIILSVYTLTLFLASPVVGAFLNDIGKKNSIIIGYIIMILATLGFALLYLV
jgi:MFS family permease